MMKNFNESWSALLKSTISTGIDEIVFYKKILSDEHLQIKDEKYENDVEKISIIGKKSSEKKTYDENGNESTIEKIHNLDEISSNKHKKVKNDDVNIEFDSDDEDKQEDKDDKDESEEISDSCDETSSDKEKILSRDDIFKTIFDRNNKENLNDGEFMLKKVIFVLFRI